MTELEIGYRFEWFNKVSGAPRISIFPYGITLNQAAIDSLGKSKCVVFGIDTLAGKLAIKPADKTGFNVLYIKSTARVNSRSFIRHLVAKGFAVPTEKVVAEWDDDLGSLVIELERVEKND